MAPSSADMQGALYGTGTPCLTPSIPGFAITRARIHRRYQWIGSEQRQRKLANTYRRVPQKSCSNSRCVSTLRSSRLPVSSLLCADRIGGLQTADPLDAEVAAWWKKKADEIYTLIPDFGGFVVKANSEGQPGPRTYNRTHADGANMLAAAVAPHQGVIMWRAFVYDMKPGLRPCRRGL